MDDNDNQEILITQSGLDELKQEYNELISVKRPQVLKDLETARSLGDLSENAAWSEARQRQSFIEGRISEVEEILKRARVAPVIKTGEAQMGSKVKVHLDGEEQEFMLVSETEADIKKGKVSTQSPLGKALVGQKAGQKIHVETPIGQVEYTVVSVE